MPSPTDERTLHGFLMRHRRHITVALLIVVSYLACTWLSERLLDHPGTLFPASAVMLSILFLEGIELWPAVYIAALAGEILFGYPLLLVLVFPVAQTLQAVAGAYLLRVTKVDALFRTSRDIFLLLGIVAVVSLIAPTLGSLAGMLGASFFGSPYHAATWGLRYIGTLFCLLIIVPFLLRWFTKSRFSRTGIEILETVAVFSVVIGLDLLAFIRGIEDIGGIPTIYFLLIPLFWIALRLRPRFVTLALLITSVFAIASLYAGASIPSPDVFSMRLFQTEEFLIVLAIIFFIMVSLEEDRRRNANLLRSQVATLENAVSRILSESKAKNDFIAVLAHELRNPLAPVVSAIDLLKLTEGRAKDETEMLTMMEGRMSTVRRLLDDLLDISRISEGKMAVKKEHIDVGTLVRRAILSTTHHFTERHQSLTVKPSKEPLFIQGDPVRIEQIFTNLLTNASRYSDSGDKIAVTVKKAGESAQITVTDTGMGIKPEDLEQIFTPFHQLDIGAQVRKGLGIGLALVRSFVDMHGGSVVASSKGLGHGSQFVVTLPLAGAEEESPTEPVPKNEKTPASTATTRRHRKLLVLIVDDNDAAAASMGRLLELKGCSVAYAYDGAQAVQMTPEISPDIVLLDIGLPDYDGYTVAKTLRARGFSGRLIALTGYSTDDAKREGATAGFDHYLVKPAGLAELKQVIPEIA